MARFDFSNAQANFNLTNTEQLIPDPDSVVIEREVEFAVPTAIRVTTVEGHIFRFVIDGDDELSARIVRIEVDLAGTDSDISDVVITDFGDPLVSNLADQFPQTDGSIDFAAVPTFLISLLLEGETEVIAPTDDFELTFFTNFIDLDSGVHFGDDSVLRGNFQDGFDFEGNSEVRNLSGDAVYFGGSIDFLGTSTNFDGDVQFVSGEAKLFGGNDTLIFTDEAPNVPEFFDIFARGDAEEVSDDAVAIGGDDFIDARLATGVERTDIQGDFDDVKDNAFVQGGDDTIYGITLIENRLHGDVKDLFNESRAVGGDDTLYGGDVDDQLFGDWRSGGYSETRIGGDDTLYGGAGNDEIVGGGGNDMLYAGSGDDELEGEEGDDFIFLSTGADSADGGTGFDTVSYFDVDADITAVLGQDVPEIGFATSSAFAGEQAINNFEAYEGSDTGKDRVESFDSARVITTNGGDDVVVSATDGETVNLGAGNDLVKTGGVDNDYAGGSGLDTITYSQFTDGVRIDLRDNTVSGEGVSGDTIDSFERANGSNTGEDLLLGTDTGNILKGLGGDDRLSARGGNDKLFGGAGDDYLDAGAGRDQLFGGDGVDTFHFDKGHGVDIIKDFENNVDRIEIDGFGDDFNFRDNARQRDDGVLIDFGEGDFLLIEGALIGQLTNDLFVV